MHTKQLKTLNDSLREFLHKCNTPEEIQKLKDTLTSLHGCIEELSLTRKELNSNVPVIAHRAANEVMTPWKNEVRAAAALLQKQLDSQVQRWGDDSKWQVAMDGRHDGMQSCIERLCREVKEQRDMLVRVQADQRFQTDKLVGAFRSWVHEGEWQKAFDVRIDKMSASVEAMVCEVQSQRQQLKYVESGQSNLREQFGCALRQTVIDIQDVNAKSAHQFREDLTHDLDGLKKYTQEFLAERSTHTDQILGGINARMMDWESSSKKEVKEWLDKAYNLQQQLTESIGEVEHLRVSSSAAHTEASELKAVTKELSEQLCESTRALDQARHASLCEGMKRLKDIEGRGNLKINRQSGDVKLTTPLPFIVPAPKDHNPTAGFTDPGAARIILQDVAEVVRICDCQLDVTFAVKVPKGGAQPFWDELTQNRLNLVKDALMGNGIPDDYLLLRGTAASHNMDTMTFQLDRRLFVSAPTAGKRAASPSPRK